jgi:hypothetical protein
MDASARVMRRRGRSWPRTARTAAVIIATTGLALLTAACGSPSAAGSGGSPNAGGSASSPSAVSYSHCMRSHGVPNFPDLTTDSQGQPFINVSAQGISDSMSHSAQFTTKLNECQRETGNFPYSMG